ncbi:hypothetical protein RJT30_01980 [Buchnera aphidicola (Mollitrichosiphum nigrofasciatum)]|uniref:hypothetical protein n=1 Tax=Buchnera aphidicola TaxID=9 RepID=UPI0031B86F9A
MSSILVVDKENDVLINIKNRIENLFLQKKNKLNNFHDKNNIISDSCVLHKKDVDYNIYKNLIDYSANPKEEQKKEINKKIVHEKYLDDTSLMPMYMFDQDSKLGYNGTVITNGKSDTLRISSLPIDKKDNIHINENSIYFTDAEILERINNLITSENKKNEKKSEEKILNNIQNSKYDDLVNEDNLLNEYELSPTLYDILSFGNVDYSKNTPWKISRIFDKSIKNFSTSGALNYSFKYLSRTQALNPNFIHDLKDFDLTINGVQIKSDKEKDILEKFKELIPELKSQQLISTYVNRAILAQPYLNLLRENPELTQFRPTNSILKCNIEKINEDTYKILITDITTLEVGQDAVTKIYDSCGARTAMIISKVDDPKLQHLYFIK